MVSVHRPDRFSIRSPDNISRSGVWAEYTSLGYHEGGSERKDSDMGPVGLPEMFAIFVIALLLFGPKKLPELGRTLGKALSEFRRAKNELKGTWESHLRELERETQVSSPSWTSSTPTYSSGYSYPYEDYNHHGSDLPAYSEPAKIESATTPAALPQAEPVTPPSQPLAAEIEPAAVPGTVARSNGIRPLENHPQPEVPASEKREEHPV
jgi:sec-independent protein translocase protein TatA